MEANPDESVKELMRDILIAVELMVKSQNDLMKLAKGGGGSEDAKRQKNRNPQKRRHIRSILEEGKLSEETKSAQQQEAERLARLETVKQFREVAQKKKKEVVICLSSDEEEEVKKPNPPKKVPYDFTDDRGNRPDENGRLLVNPEHPAEDPDLFIAEHLSNVLKPHQLGGVRFLYSNVVENLTQYSNSPGLGCILAHSMGLGKTLQIVSFLDVLFRCTETQHALVIVPVNTIQNWVQEFEKWLPRDVTGRTFDIFVLNDLCKTIQQRATQIINWRTSRGVLIMGYEMFRLMVTKDFRSIAAQNREKDKRKRKRKKVDTGAGPTEVIDIEEEEIQESLSQDMREALLDPGPDIVICDEGHRIKNLQAETSKTLNEIKTLRRVVLTGYPMQNNLMEYYHMIGFVRPRYLGTRQEFGNMFERPIRNGQCIDSTPKDIRIARGRTHVLINLVRGFVQRRGHELLKNILCEKKEFVLLMRKSPIQYRLYKQFLSQFHHSGDLENPLKAFAVCCKIWNHPDILYRFLEKRKRGNGEPEDDFDMIELGTANGAVFKSPALTQRWAAKSQGPTGGINYDWAEEVLDGYESQKLENGYKMLVTFQILRGAIAKGEKVLLFTQSLFTLDLLEEYLAMDSSFFSGPNPVRWKKNHTYFRLDGSTGATERAKQVTRFNNEANVYLFLISTKAGSLGINLTGSSRSIIFDASWNPCHDAQAICRMYRYGQTKPTFVYRLVTDNSMERAIFNRQLGKKGVADRVVDEKEVDANVTEHELQNLMMFEEQKDLDPPEHYGGVESWSLGDEVLETTISMFPYAFSQEPMSHESLILNREKLMTQGEKEEAMRDYQREMREIRGGYGSGFRTPQRSNSSASGFGYSSSHFLPYEDRPSSTNDFMSSISKASSYFQMDDILRSRPAPSALVSPVQNPIPVPMRLHSSSSTPFLDNMFGAQTGLQQQISPQQPPPPYYRNTPPSQGSIAQAMAPNYPPPAGSSSVVSGGVQSPSTRTEVRHITCTQEAKMASISNYGQDVTVYPGQQAVIVKTMQGIYLRLPNGHILDAKGSIYDDTNLNPLPSAARGDVVDLCDSD